MCIGGRQADQEQSRVADAIEDAMPPVVHALDVEGVEEHAEVLAAAAGEPAVIGLDPLLEFGDAALSIVAPGVADEEVVGHGVRYPGATIPLGLVESPRGADAIRTLPLSDILHRAHR